MCAIRSSARCLSAFSTSSESDSSENRDVRSSRLEDEGVGKTVASHNISEGNSWLGGREGVQRVSKREREREREGSRGSCGGGYSSS